MSAPIIKYLGEAGTRELITLIKADLARKEELSKFTTMPLAADHIGRIVQYIGATVPLYTKGYFYYSDGAVWTQINVQPATQGSGGFEVVDVLPAWSTADPDKVYYVKSGTVLTGYIKEPATANVWYSLEGGSGSMQFVTVLPDWDAAIDNTVYILNEGGKLSVYTKGDTASQWNELAGHEALPIETIDEVFEEVFD